MGWDAHYESRIIVQIMWIFLQSENNIVYLRISPVPLANPSNTSLIICDIYDKIFGCKARGAELIFGKWHFKVGN